MNLRKAWRVAKRKRPHAIIFLGDMMDSGFADMDIMECVRDCLRSWLLLPLPLPTLTPLVPSQP